MKLRLLSLTLALTAWSMTSCKDTAAAAQEAEATSEQTETAAPAQLQTASFAVEGMSCEIGCANQIEKKLAKFDGVNEADVNYEAKTATVTFDANKVSTTDLIDVIQGAADGNTYKATLEQAAAKGTSAVNQTEPKKEKKSKKNKQTTTAEPTTAPSTDAKPACASGEMKASGCCSAKKA